MPISVADLNLPLTGEKGWAPKLRAAFGLMATAVNDAVGVISGAVSTNDAAVAATVDAGAATRAALRASFAPAVFPAAVADGVSDDTLAVQAAVDACPVGGVVDGHGLTYMVSSVLLKSNITFRNFNFITKGGAVDFVSPVTIGAYDDTTLRENIRIQNVHVNGNRSNQTSIGPSEDGGRHGFRLLGRIENVLIEDCSATLCASDGISLFHGTGMSGFLQLDTGIMKNIRLVRCDFTFNRRHGGSADSLDGFYVQDCTFNDNGLDINGGLVEGDEGSRLGGNLYGNGFDVEEYAINTWAGNMVFENCEMVRNAKSGFLAYQPGVNLADDPSWVVRGPFRFVGGKYDNGVAPSADFYGIDFTPLFANRALGAYFTDVSIDGVEVVGAVGLRSVSRASHKGGLVDGPTGNIGNADYVSDLTVDVARGSKPYASNQSTIKYLPAPGETRWLPATAWQIVGGAPAVTTTNFVSTWALRDAQTDRLGITVDVPADWRSAHVDLVWFTSSSSGDARFRLDRGSLVAGATVADAASGAVVTATAAAVNVVAEHRLASALSLTGGLINLELLRLGADAADTLAASAQVLGVRITRVS